MGKRKAGRPLSKPRKRKYFGNQFTAGRQVVDCHDDIAAQVQAPDPSSMKLQQFSFISSHEEEDSDVSDVEESEEPASATEGSRIIDLSILAELISASAVCASCRAGNLSCREVRRFGMAQELELKCDACGHSVSRVLAKKRVVHKTNMYEVNRKAVLGMRLIGRGFQALCTLSSILDMPAPMRKSTFYKHQKVVAEAVVDIGKESMRKAASTVLAVRQGEQRPDEIAVSTDGTWMRRGHSSLYGVQTVLAWDTHQVVDVQVLSKHCPQCQVWNADLTSGKKTREQFDVWKQTHTESCGVNTNVSAPAMEAKAVVQLWQRSLDLNGLKYVAYIGDGDSKGFSNVLEAKPYGDVEIVKEECVGHVQKRLGKGLRELKQKLGTTKLSDGKAIGGKGRLTDKLIDTLQNFYGKAVRDNAGNVTDTSRAIWASVCHRASSEAKPFHQFCPAGPESWCGFQRMEAGGGSYTHHDAIPPVVFDTIKPVYLRLTEKSLLSRCTRSATQNTNESLNGTIWHLCPKESFCGPRTVEMAVHLAVGIMNHGVAAIIPKIIGRMKCSAGYYTIKALEKSDAERIYHSARKSSEIEKKARKKRRAIRKGFIDKEAEVEGVTYSAGGF